jgi:hypothetical protein
VSVQHPLFSVRSASIVQRLLVSIRSVSVQRLFSTRCSASVE